MSGADFINKQAPDFFLPLVGGGSRFALSNLSGHNVILHFWSAECPWSRRADLVLVYRQAAWERKNVRIVGLACSPNETEAEIKHEVEQRRLKYPIVMDYAQDIANTYRVECTPHFVVIDTRAIVRYVGALDDATAAQRLPRRIYLDAAVDAVVRGVAPDPAYTVAYGSPIVRRGIGQS